MSVSRNPLRVRASHLSTLLTAPSGAFIADVETALAHKPDWLTLTEVAGRRDELAKMLKGTGYGAVLFDSRETAVLFNRDAGVRVVAEQEWKAHGPGPGYNSRYLTMAGLVYEDECFNVFSGHWLAHLDDSAARVRDHNRMTTLACRLMKIKSKGKRIATLGCDANENDRPGSAEDKALGNMATQFKQAGITTTWDEDRNHPGTHGNRTIDLLATVDRDRRVSVKKNSTKHVNVRGDHDLITAILEVAR